MWDDSCGKIWLIPERLTVLKPVSPARCVDCENYVEGDPCHVCEFIKKQKPKTNADRIRSMSDEELAMFIRDQIIDRNIGIPSETWLNWLREEVEDGSDNR